MLVSPSQCSLSDSALRQRKNQWDLLVRCPATVFHRAMSEAAASAALNGGKRDWVGSLAGAGCGGAGLWDG